MKLSLLMLLRNHLHLSLHLIVRATQKETLLKKIVVAGKVKEIGRSTGGKPMQEKGSLLCLSLISTGSLSTFLFQLYDWLRLFLLMDRC